MKLHQKKKRVEISNELSEVACFVAVLIISQLVMELAAAIARSALGMHVSNAHHSTLYAHVRHLTPMNIARTDTFFDPETRQSPSHRAIHQGTPQQKHFST